MRKPGWFRVVEKDDGHVLGCLCFKNADLWATIEAKTVEVAYATRNVDQAPLPVVQALDNRVILDGSKWSVVDKRSLALTTVGMSGKHELPIVIGDEVLGVRVVAQDDDGRFLRGTVRANLAETLVGEASLGPDVA